jgi:type IV secretory pathway VirB10-like protein
MDPNVRTEQEHTVVNSPGQRRESVTERTERGTKPVGLSTGTIALIAVLALVAVGVIVYLVANRNANESANRNANVDVASQSNPQQQPPVIVQQPAPAQQAPVVIQQPAPAQQAPVVVQQPAPPSQRESTSANDDARMQDIATKKLAGEPDMAAVVISINDAQAVLTGTVSSAATKAKAEQLVKAVRGVKSVDNKIVVSG